MKTFLLALIATIVFATNAVRQLNWATYTVNAKGWNRYIRDMIWMTDGYGDYVRHYLRAMAEFPELAPDNKNKLLSSNSVVKDISCNSEKIEYQTYDSVSTEIFRLNRKPTRIFVDDQALKQFSDKVKLGYTWQSMNKGGVLTINKNGTNISVVL